MDADNEIVRCHNTVIELCKTRELNVENLLKTTNDRLESIQGNRFFEIEIDKEHTLLYSTFANLKSKTLESQITDMLKNNKHLKNIIMVIKEEKISPMITKSILNLSTKEGIQIDVFEMHKLLFDISKHFMVPKHEVISDEQEIRNILDKYKLKSPMQLQLILKDDPMARYIGAMPGNIVKITRDSEAGGETIVYRYCIKGSIS